jgi:hypothetical protein
MKPEDKAAIKTGAATALVVGTIAFCIPNPAAWAAVIWGSYRMGKQARDREIERQVKRYQSTDQDHCI